MFSGRHISLLPNRIERRLSLSCRELGRTRRIFAGKDAVRIPETSLNKALVLRERSAPDATAIIMNFDRYAIPFFGTLVSRTYSLPALYALS